MPNLLNVFSAWVGSCGDEAGKSEQIRETRLELAVILESRFFSILRSWVSAVSRVRQDSEGLLFAVITEELLLLRVAIRAETPTAAQLSRSEERDILWAPVLTPFCSLIASAASVWPCRRFNRNSATVSPLNCNGSRSWGRDDFKPVVWARRRNLRSTPALQNRRGALYRRRRPRRDFHFVSSIAFGAGGHGHRPSHGFADVDGDTRRNYDAHRRGRILGLFASAIAVRRMTGPTVFCSSSAAGRGSAKIVKLLPPLKMRQSTLNELIGFVPKSKVIPDGPRPRPTFK